MWAHGGPDRFLGNPGPDELHGGAGNDTLKGNNGHDDPVRDDSSGDRDVVCGNTGGDHVDGADDDPNDSVMGNEGVDDVDCDGGDFCAPVGNCDGY